ncbi:MAG: hypothetical protein LIO95_10020 [Clostridiales bacterium]|nr:hypothetical protein [Clostridiales bacterium]
MKQKKKTHHSKPHGGGETYAARQRATRQTYIQATCDIYTQFVFDMACLVLHDKYGFGRKRLLEFHQVLDEAQVQFHPMLDCGDESGYLRDKLDGMLREIWGRRPEAVRGAVRLGQKYHLGG